MHLISEDDAIKALRKAILNLMDSLPTTIIDGEECCADNRLCNAYLEANKAVSNALRKILSWHTEDPEENGEYLVTWETTWKGKTCRKIAIAEWDYDDWVVEDWIRESYWDIHIIAWMPLPDLYTETF